MCGAIGKVKTAIRIKVSVLCVHKALTRRLNHAHIFDARCRLKLELADVYETIELFLAHL
jgi:hypothetical protein